MYKCVNFVWQARVKDDIVMVNIGTCRSDAIANKPTLAQDVKMEKQREMEAAMNVIFSLAQLIKCSSEMTVAGCQFVKMWLHKMFLEYILSEQIISMPLISGYLSIPNKTFPITAIPSLE